MTARPGTRPMRPRRRRSRRRRRPPSLRPAAAEPEPAQPQPEARAASPSRTPTVALGPIYASPSARRLARELGVELSRVSGSGRKGRITKDDVQQAADGGRPSAAPAAPAARGRPRSAAVAVGRLREVRAGGARPALADPADLGTEPGAQLGDDPARHAQRRGGHHRARGVAQAAQRRADATSR